MAKRNKSGAPTVSLFPFLSILACVIGTLTLMISALAIGQMDTPELDSANQVDEIQRQQARLRESIDALKQDVDLGQASASIATKQRAAVQLEVTELEQKQKQLESERTPTVVVPPAKPIANEADQLATRLRELEQELAQRRDEEKKLQEELATREKKPDEAVVKIRPGGTGVGLRPIFVECTKTSIVLHDKAQPVRVRTADIATDAAFLALARRVAEQPKTRIIFLIRDDGLSTYHRARSVATNNYAPNGKLPVIGQGKLDLSVFGIRSAS